jgi:RNA polymerase sigma factor (sigma-70 family)
LDTEKYEGLVGTIAYEFSRKYFMVDAADIRQELWVWFLEHPNKVQVWESLDGKQSVKLIAKSLRNEAKDYCQKQKAHSVGYRVEDNYYYDKELIEVLLPSVLRGDTVPPAVNDNLSTNTNRVVSEGGNWFAMMADVSRGFKRLTEEQQSIIYLRFGDGCDNKTFATEMAISEDAARMRVNRALNNLVNILGGQKPRRDDDYRGEELDDRREELSGDTGREDSESDMGE